MPQESSRSAISERSLGLDIKPLGSQKARIVKSCGEVGETAPQGSETQHFSQGVNLKYLHDGMKSILEPDPYHPSNLDEERGVPLQVYAKNGFCIAVFAWGAVAFPPEMEARLCELIGRNIAILHLNGRFYVRELDGEPTSCIMTPGAGSGQSFAQKAGEGC